MRLPVVAGVGDWRPAPLRYRNKGVRHARWNCHSVIAGYNPWAARAHRIRMCMLTSFEPLTVTSISKTPKKKWYVVYDDVEDGKGKKER